MEAGLINPDFTYSRRSLYRIVLRRLVKLGFIKLLTGYREGRPQQVYAPIIQPIPKRPPRGYNFWNMAWQICERWNKEWDKIDH